MILVGVLGMRSSCYIRELQDGDGDGHDNDHDKDGDKDGDTYIL